MSPIPPLNSVEVPFRGIRSARLHPCGRARRVVFYSNEIAGSLGHLRRTLAIAGRLADLDPHATSMILTSSMIEPFFPLPPRVDSVRLPATAREQNGSHRPERLTLEMPSLHGLRSDVSLAATLAFDPDVVVVDQLPLGLAGELEPTIKALKSSGDTRLVLGLRDIEDSPARVREKWGLHMRSAIERYYDAVLVYGPSSCPDAIDCMGWERLDVPVVHVGYVSPQMPESGPNDLEPGYLLATAGGGGDGFPMLAGVAEAIREHPLPCPVVMVAGPLMPAHDANRLRELADAAGIQLFDSRADMHRVIAGARALVSRAGYNTVAEVMQARKPALFVPRVRPTQEQLVRAGALAESGLQDMLHPDDVSGATMRVALERLLARPASDLDVESHAGTERAAGVLAGLAMFPTTPASDVPSLADLIHPAA